MDLNIGKEVAAMKRMTVNELRAKYAEVFGEETKARHKQWLVRRRSRDRSLQTASYPRIAQPEGSTQWSRAGAHSACRVRHIAALLPRNPRRGLAHLLHYGQHAGREPRSRDPQPAHKPLPRRRPAAAVLRHRRSRGQYAAAPHGIAR
jgi:hypothetical protein